MLALSGIAVIVVGFALRANPLLVVALAAAASGLGAGLTPLGVLAAFGKAFNDNRYITLVWIMLPVIGLLERAGLQGARADADRRGTRRDRRAVAAGVHAVPPGHGRRVGLKDIAGHPQTVRPLVAPMAEAAAERQGSTDPQGIRAMAAATDNVGLFFGEDIFIAIASILLIKGFLEANGIVLAPLELSVWAIPTAIAAVVVHGARLLWLDRRLGLAAASPLPEREGPGVGLARIRQTELAEVPPPTPPVPGGGQER